MWVKISLYKSQEYENWKCDKYSSSMIEKCWTKKIEEEKGNFKQKLLISDGWSRNVCNYCITVESSIESN